MSDLFWSSDRQFALMRDVAPGTDQWQNQSQYNQSLHGNGQPQVKPEGRWYNDCLMPLPHKTEGTQKTVHPRNINTRK